MSEEKSQTEVQDTTDQADSVDAGQSVEPSTNAESGTTDDSAKPDDWWDTTGLDEKVGKRIKDIQRQYGKKSEELSRFRKQLDDSQGQLNTVTESVRQALLSPNWQQEVEKARLELMGGNPQGLTNPQTNQMPRPRRELATHEDLHEYMAEVLKWQSNQLRQEYDAKLSSELNRISQPIYKDRWLNADQKLKEKYPDVYEKYSSSVLQKAATPMFQSLRQSGIDEAQVLEIVFLATASDDVLKHTRQQALRSVQVKKESNTERARKHVNTSGKQKTKEDILEEIRSIGLSAES